MRNRAWEQLVSRREVPRARYYSGHLYDLRAQVMAGLGRRPRNLIAKYYSGHPVDLRARVMAGWGNA